MFSGGREKQHQAVMGNETPMSFVLLEDAKQQQL